jgi:hypothetical protein
MPAAVYSPAAVDSLEQQLRLTLRPIEPDKQFVDHLHNRLTTSPAMTLERRSSTAFGLLLIAFSLMTGVILIGIIRIFRQPSAV